MKHKQSTKIFIQKEIKVTVAYIFYTIDFLKFK